MEQTDLVDSVLAQTLAKTSLSPPQLTAKEKVKRIIQSYMVNKDNEGFCIAFDDVWPLSGYSRKADAKRRLQSKRLGFELGKHYTITCRPEKRIHHGGHNKEIIHLTAASTIKFAATAGTPQGSCFVDFLLEMKRIVDLEAETSPTVRKKRKVAYASLQGDLERSFLRDTKCTLHNRIRDRIAGELGGQVEVVNALGISDVESPTVVVEVKPLHECKHGLGQVLCYCGSTGKSPRLHLYGETPPKQEFKDVCASLGVDLTFERCLSGKC